VNFLFALTAFLVLGGGAFLMCWAMIIVSVWLAVVSFFLFMMGGALYGLSLCLE
jgi:hypothetical protein